MVAGYVLPTPGCGMNVLIDGVFFQLANTGIARVWRSVLPQLAKLPDLTITMLDRGNCPDIDGIRKAQFPSYKDKHNTADSQLIQRMCAEFSADVFISTYYTTPLTTPSVAVLYDMIPERMGFELDMRAWQEKELCIAHARRHLCISGQTRADLLEFYPELDPANVLVAPCGVDSLVFQPRRRGGAGRLSDAPRPCADPTFSWSARGHRTRVTRTRSCCSRRSPPCRTSTVISCVSAANRNSKTGSSR